MKNQRKNTIISSAVGLVSLALAYMPIPGLKQTIVVVSGTELQEVLPKIEQAFEQQYPDIKVELKFQGSQDIVNNYINEKNDFKATVLIPASGEILEEIKKRSNNPQIFFDSPQPIAKTILVGIAWPERGKVIFPDGKFSWNKLQQAMTVKNWAGVGGKSNWGSFDFLTTDPTRSNSGQMTLSLWKKSITDQLSDPRIEDMFSLLERSVYQPPRSTDILLQEFITRGPNDADVATVYESIALHRWQQSGANQGNSYQIYYPNPTMETVITAAVLTPNIDKYTQEAAVKFVKFLTDQSQQQTLIEYGFRPVINLDLKAVSNSPWNQNIPGVEAQPTIQIIPPPNEQEIGEIQRLWVRVGGN